MHFSLLSLSLPLLPFVLSSPLDAVPAPVTLPVLARAPTPEPLDLSNSSSSSTLASRTFSHAPSIWGSGGWWGQNDCADASKSALCFSRGWGWGCNRQCICIPPPQYDGCKLDHRWNDCRSKGHGWGCDNKCECVPPPQTCKDTIYQDCRSKGKGTNQQCSCECRPWVKWYCQKKGGWLTDNCQCQLPSKKASHARNLAKIKRGLCPDTHTACALNPTAKRPQFECVDTRSALDSCGGCASEGTGVDCSLIEGAEDVSCSAGACVVASCERGWSVSADKTTCTRKPLAALLAAAEQVMPY